MSQIFKSFLEHEKVIKYFLRRFFPNKHDVDEISQETFLRAFVAESKHSINEPKAFLFQTAKNIALNKKQLKSHTTTEYIEDSELTDVLLDSNAVPIDEQLHSQRKLTAFEEAVATLPTKCRETFIMCKVEGMSYQEIAEKRGIAQSTVEKHIAKGLLLCSDYLRLRGYDSRAVNATIVAYPNNTKATPFVTSTKSK